MATATGFDFEMAQALRRSHCNRAGHEHECVGEMTIARGKVCLNCALCGPAEHIPGWCSATDNVLRAVFSAAGINWDCLTLEDRVRAIRKHKVSVK